MMRTNATLTTILSEAPAVQGQSGRRFFALLEVSIVILVFVGFSRTYYLHSLFTMPGLSVFLHMHGAVMTGWIAFFAFQTFLVASNHTRIHRTLGVFGAGYAALVVAMGCTATVLAARREVLAHSQFVFSFLTVLALELTQMLLFASLVASGVWMTNRAGYHKRLNAFGHLLHASESHCPPVRVGGIWKQHPDPDFLVLIGYRSCIA